MPRNPLDIETVQDFIEYTTELYSCLGVKLPLGNQENATDELNTYQ